LEGGEDNEDNVTTKGEVRQVEEEGKPAIVIKGDKQIPIDVDIVDIYDEDEKMPLAKLFILDVIKEELNNVEINKNQVKNLVEQFKSLQESKANTKRREIDTKIKKLIHGVMIPHVEHIILVERTKIKPYTRDGMFHLIL
jgi:hypothetical protein